jgi:hypothetical protein
VPKLSQELVRIVASDDVVRNRHPDGRRRLHRAVGSGHQSLKAFAHGQNHHRELSNRDLGLDVVHPDDRVAPLIFDDELQRGIEYLGAAQACGRPVDVRAEQRPLVIRLATASAGLGQ